MTASTPPRGPWPLALSIIQLDVILLAAAGVRGAGGTRSGGPCPAPAMANGRSRMHGGTSPGAPRGNKNALKHGHYTAEAIAQRREISALLRAMKALASTSNT